MGNLKIGFVLDDTLDTPDGVQQYVLTLGAWLSGNGHQVHYLVGQTQRTDIPNIHSLSKNVKVQFNGNRMSTPRPSSSKVIRQLLAREKFDVLHVQMPYSPFLAARILSQAPPQTALFGTFHIAPHSASVRVGNFLLGKMLSRSLRKFDTIFAVSQAAADFALSAYRVNTSILPNVVKVAHFKNAQPVTAPPDTDRIIMFLGRLVPRKGCQILLQALQILQSEGKLEGVHTYICGKGPLMEKLQEYTVQSDLTGYVEFTGYVNDAKKAQFLKSADIAVFPSTGGESFGIVLIEAMAADYPVVIGADNEGYATVLKPYPDALFRAGDSRALARKLDQLIHDEAARQQAILWQKMYIQQFDVDVVGRRLVGRYYEVLRKKKTVR
jgi:phosphatidylinositol alpha-mannosyltransferase